MYSRAEDFFKIEDLLDVVHLLLPRLPSAGVSVLPSHGAASPAQVRPTVGFGRMGRCGEEGKKGKRKLKTACFVEETGLARVPEVFFGESRCCVLRCGRTM